MGSALFPLFYQLLLNIVVAHSLRKCYTSQLSTALATSQSLQIDFCVALPNILTAPPGLGSATFFIGLLVTVLEGYEKEKMVVEQSHVNVVYVNKKKENVRRRRRRGGGAPEA